uniref:CSON000137 protein n=1 Tax=Culicoides sonorensis TaxID=179676 RepID=A0A336LSK0_CULSO
MMPNESRDNKCICFRKLATIFCGTCNSMTKGRVKRSCPKHKNCVFLFDRTFCHNCKSPLSSLVEIPIDFSVVENEKLKRAIFGFGFEVGASLRFHPGGTGATAVILVFPPEFLVIF